MPVKSSSKQQWMEREIEIAFKNGLDGSEKRKINALCLGPLAVHGTQNKTMPLKPGDRKYTLTHIPSCLAILQSNSNTDLKKIAVFLVDRFSAAFSHPTDEAIRGLLPVSVYEWIGVCFRAGGWCEPPK